MENNRPIYIFDLDGTLALIDHRRSLVEAPWIEVPRGTALKPGQKHRIAENCMEIPDPNFKPDWPLFYAMCHRDQPNMPVIRTFLNLYMTGAEIRIWSGRSDEVKQQTIMWLATWTTIKAHFIGEMLTMRKEGDFTPDEQLKRGWLNKLQPNERQRLVAVFDDRNKVVSMWRKEGVACFQVAPGEF